MGTLTPKGYKLPSIGDRDFWGQLLFNFTRTSAHKHDGIDSEKLNASTFDKNHGVIEAADWNAVPGQPGTYSQVVTVPVGTLTSTMLVRFYLDNGADAGHEFFPSIRNVTATTYEIFINDNSAVLKAIYG